MKQASSEFVARVLRKQQPGLIFGHAHSLYMLAAVPWRQGEASADIRPNGCIISTAMPLHDYQRTVIADGCSA